MWTKILTWRLIEVAVSDGLWKPITLSRGGPPLSHIFFADDLILFGEASVSQFNVMVNCLNSFCSFSGQKVNYQKV